MKSQYRRQLLNAFRVFAAIPILLVMLFPSSAGIAKGPAQGGNGLTATLSFSSAPIVGRAAELVLTVAGAKSANFEAEITLPDGLELVSGDLKAAGKASEGAGWKHALVVKVLAEGEYKITALVKAGNQKGVATDLYLASTKTNASAGQIPVKAPGELTLVPPGREGAGEGNVTVEQSPDVEFASNQADLDTGQPVVSQASDQAISTEKPQEKYLLRKDLGMASEEHPLNFEVNAATEPVENLSGDMVVTRTAKDSSEPVVVNKADLGERIYAPAIGRNSNFEGAEPGLLAGPDLVVLDMWSNTNPLQYNTYENVYFMVRNQGDTAVNTTFRIVVWIGGNYINSWYMDALGVGQTATSFFSIRIGTAAYWAIAAAVDYDGKVVESNEANNTRYEYWVWMSPGKDVMVEDLYATTNPLLGGEWETLVLALRNVGTTAITETFYSKLYVGGSQVGYWYTAGLASQSATYGVVQVSVKPGYYQIYGTTDITSAVAEAIESNNYRYEYWNWYYSGGADLTTLDIFSTTWPPTGGVAENISWRVKNIGTTAAYITQGETVSELSVLGVQPGGSVKVTWDAELNTPSQIDGDIAVSGPVGQPEVAAANFFSTYGGLYGIRDASQELAQMNIKPDDLGMQHIRYQQKYQGLDVYGRQMIVHVGKDGRIASTNGSFVPGINVSTTPTLSPEAALAAAREYAKAPAAEQLEAPKVWIYAVGADGHLAYQVRMTVDNLPYSAFIDAHTGEVLDASSEIHDARNRLTYNANHTWSDAGLPGTLMLNEASVGSADAVAWTTHQNTRTVYDYYWGTFGRDSYNGAGANLVSSVHFGVNYNNAFWYPAKQQMVYGDGDGVRFRALGLGLDVVGHELTHGVIDSVGGLTYQRQSGALNESVADFFGAMIDRNDWLMGEDVYTPAIAGDALRSLSNPPAYGQPDHWSNFRDYPAGTVCSSNTNDNCGVHYNSGIPNKAFYLMSDGGLFHGIQVYGIGRGKAERIVYRALDLYFIPSTTFLQARNNLITAANDIFGIHSTEAHTVQDAFAAVGVGGQAGFYVDIYIDNALKTWWWINELKPGWTAQAGTSFTLAKGSHTIGILADSLGFIPETNESNNNRYEIWNWQ